MIPEIQKLGLMGSILDHEENQIMKHRIGIYLGLCFLLGSLCLTARSCIPYFKKHFPLRVKFSTFDVAQLYMILAVCTWIYFTCMVNNSPRFHESWQSAHRMSIMVGLHVLYTAAYYFIIKFVVTGIPAEHREPQSANIIRITVKLSMFIAWGCSGTFWKMVVTHPLELNSTAYESTFYTNVAINSLYLWEVLFRDLRPVNIIHHGIACMGFNTFHEWYSVVEPGRTGVIMPTMGSLIESFCCIGSVAYRFVPRGVFLSRFLMAITIFILVSYNLLLVGYLSVLIGYWNFFSVPWRCVSMPALAAFTYPAQMNMAYMFYSLSKKAMRPETSAKVREATATSTRTTTISRTETLKLRRGEVVH